MILQMFHTIILAYDVSVVCVLFRFPLNEMCVQNQNIFRFRFHSARFTF